MATNSWNLSIEWSAVQSVLTQKYKDFAGEKHSSLPCFTVSEEEKGFMTLTPVQQLV